MTEHEASFIIGELLAALVIVGVMFFEVVRAFRKIDTRLDRFEGTVDRFEEHVGSKLDDLTARIDALTATIEGGHSNAPPKRPKRPTFRIVRGAKR
jgi:hypothetical protein